MSNSPIKILIAGEGGQGVQALAEILAKSAYNVGYRTSYIPNFGVEQRGGVSLAFIQISDSPIPYPKFKIADLLVVLASRAIERIFPHYNEKTKILNGIGFVHRPEEAGLSPRTYNILILGLIFSQISQVLPKLEKEVIFQALEERFFGKPKEVILENKKAFLLGEGIGKNLPDFAKKLIRIPVLDHRRKPPEIFKSKKIKATIYPNLCKSCGLCQEVCPTKALFWDPERVGLYGTPIIKISIEKCIGCGNCQRICPECAIDIERKKE